VVRFELASPETRTSPDLRADALLIMLLNEHEKEAMRSSTGANCSCEKCVRKRKKKLLFFAQFIDTDDRHNKHSTVYALGVKVHTYTGAGVVSAEKYPPPLTFFLCDKSFSTYVNWTVIVYLHVLCLLFIQNNC
jgi:hypothetical protein